MFTIPSRNEARIGCPQHRRVTAFAGALVAAALLAAPAMGAGKSGKDAPPPAAKKAAPAAAPAGMPGTTDEHPSFSVDMVMKHDGKNFTMRRTVDGPRSRMDISAEGTEMVQITLGDEAGTTYSLMPKEKRAIKQSSKAMMARMPKSEAKEEEPAPAGKPGELESLGKETVNDRLAEKYRVRTGEGTGLMWIDAENQLPLRMEAEGAVVDFRNYDFAPAKPELFQVPKGYDVMDMDEMMAKMPQGGMPGMGAMMGGMGGGMAGGMARGMAGNAGGSLGGSLGGALGGSLGGPIGSMIGQYVGQKIGAKIGTAAAGAVLPGK